MSQEETERQVEELKRQVAKLKERLENHEERIGWLEGVESAFSEVFSTIAGIFKGAGKAGKHDK